MAEGHLQRPTILVIDDDAAVRRTICRALNDAGLATSEAADGRDGFRQALSSPISLVVLDMLMPVCDGGETILELRSKRPELPIIAISGGGSIGYENLESIAAVFGADAFLRKPLRPNILIGLVNALLTVRAPVYRQSRKEMAPLAEGQRGLALRVRERRALNTKVG